MNGFILGEKSEQSQTFDDQGKRIPTTFIKTSPCYLIEIKEPEKHDYFSVMLGFGQVKNIKKPILGQLAKAGIKTPLRFIREFRLETKNLEHKIKVGDEIKPTLFFKKGDLIDISGISKGKGFQGVVKRHGFAGGPRTHGQSDRERAPGSIGQTTTPGRVFKGKRMAGRMGGKRATVKKLQIVDVKDDGLVVKGLVPGAIGGLLEVRSY
ncbi:50S ribosomal protein L3 [Candidatus Roizmanbacteria bacterium RIFCSPHIGHO2_02_FULL_37_15]|uniref:50S ribosomal protein L3 n=1 Tax=Candidatus Roizmanbacteria bacterium RIFCSPLOWO2_01_FULL_37_16 TaxID=1802058 RepID=A0A1F7IPB3_9BACT|nr:MAG: 50S ribosomal protein L3 [Candidatus Roizmanbacteria bacterium RIFCSPHIGHO2_01_FULL_37_16b]OGK21773.1 MAG: 50S ribosomal protein L3 [Candidatus Roizmanbacteria bacterium RIFCSPHIGHO2_02_FULL_37_15]OGK33714.1 MAG: 50S ribosomal protein L3 [Candidatus Roizmanbacteria bacterium RIFCSPHIGHO2_12_FULL_36_11]OGK45218.1 MAG: 50S ribosomal protein L3 [Candidatus Roizmanbacteria bacterium RIFCSPLOWO2_01_FULL_37_16]OGK57575.1 MAG: 50S ribosomal protein L3 [Candidatus Roizmanbacteria bacterium RIFC